MTDLEQHIQSYWGFAGKEELSAVTSLFQREKLSKHHRWSGQGGRCDKLGFIKSGLMRIYVQTDKKEVTQWISTPGSFVTDLSSLMFDMPARWDIECLTVVEIHTIRGDDYRKIGSLVPRWNEMEKLFLAKCFGMLEDRIFAHLSLNSEERYNSFFSQFPELFNQVPLQYLASMLGMTPETMSRIRTRQMNEGR